MAELTLREARERGFQGKEFFTGEYFGSLNQVEDEDAARGATGGSAYVIYYADGKGFCLFQDGSAHVWNDPGREVPAEVIRCWVEHARQVIGRAGI